MSGNSHRSDQDFEDEIQSHIEIEADRLVEQGMDRQEAIAAARRTFGNVAKTQERFYESNRWMWLDHLARSFRHAVREMQRSPVATATIILSPAVGIGAATAIFSLTDQALLRALPITEPERLVQLEWNGRFVGNGMGSVGVGDLIPYPLYEQLREENEVFEEMLARATADVHLAIGDDSEPAGAELVSGSYFSTLGVRPAVGRLLTEADNQAEDAHPVAVLSHDYWQSRLGGDPAIVGSTVRVNGYSTGVSPLFAALIHANPPVLWFPKRRTRFLRRTGKGAPL